MARKYGTRPASNVETLAAALTDPDEAARLLGGTPADWAQFNAAYAAKMGAANPDIEDQVREQVEAVFADMLRDNGSAVRKLNQAPIPRQGAGLAGRNPHALGAKVDPLFPQRDAIAADYTRAVWHRGPKDGPENVRREQLRISNAFGSVIPGDGGFLVPEEMRAGILGAALEQSVVRPRATVVPMGSLRLSWPAIDSTTNVGSVLGGVTAYWNEEGQTLTASDPDFQRIVLDAKKLVARSDIPNELIADAPALQVFLQTAYPSAVSFFEDLAYLFGSGAGEPAGMLTSTATNPALVVVAKESGQTNGTIVWQNIIKMYAQMLPGSLNRAVWLAAPDTFPQLAQMSVTVGTGGTVMWLQDGGAAAPVTILGRPLILSEKMKTLGTQGDIAFVDPTYYLIGDRQVMSMTTSEHARFTDDLTVVKLVQRCDGRPWLTSPITPANGSTSKLSAYVTLAAR